MAYTTWNYYLNTFCAGKKPLIAMGEFPYYERLAEKFIKNETFGKSESYTGNEVQECTCAIAEQYKRFETEDKYNKGSANGITSEHVGEYSVSYGGGYTLAQIEKIKENELQDILKFNLGITGMLYRGA